MHRGDAYCVFVGITIAFVGYVMLGGLVFHLLENENEDETINKTLDAFHDLIRKCIAFNFQIKIHESSNGCVYAFLGYEGLLVIMTHNIAIGAFDRAVVALVAPGFWSQWSHCSTCVTGAITSDAWNYTSSQVHNRYNCQRLAINPIQTSSIRSWEPTGGRLNKKDGLTRYGDSHVKDKTS